MKILIVPMAAMAETSGPSSRCAALAKGFADASVQEICKNAGVTTGALYTRYKGKA